MRMKTNHGTTIPEVIIAVIVFSVLMLGAMNFFVFARGFSSSAKHEMFAINMGKQAMERIQTVKWNNLNAGYLSTHGLINITAFDTDGIQYTGTGSLSTNPNLPLQPQTYKIYRHVVVWPGQSPDITVDFSILISSPSVN
jgi:Tfp pilus assembly protein PilV